MRPRVLFVSRERHTLPLPEAQRRKWDALSDRLDLRVLAAAREPQPGVDDRFALVPPRRPAALDGLLFLAGLSGRVARELRRFPADAVLVQGAHEAAAVLVARRRARSPARVVLDVQGDWRQATRLYGSRLRRLLSPAADALARVAVRRADAVRTISENTSRLVRELGVEPAAVFPTYLDAPAFLEAPPVAFPPEPRLLFVGVLERYKGLPVLLEAWELVRARLPAATLRIVGDGSLAGRLERELRRDSGIAWTRSLDAAGVAAAMDDATALCLPSPAEGMGRVVIEAMARGRPVVGSRAGGIPDVVEDGVNGVLVPPGDAPALAAALERVLAGSELERLGAAARATAEAWIVPPEEYAARIEALIRQVTA